MGWSSIQWENQAKISNKFDSFKLYIIFCKGNNEEFLKIGRTFSKVEDRFKGNKIPYDYEILFTYSASSDIVFKIENDLKRELKEYKYIPTNIFNGYSECFKIECTNSYINEIKDKLK